MSIYKAKLFDDTTESATIQLRLVATDGTEFIQNLD